MGRTGPSRGEVTEATPPATIDCCIGMRLEVQTSPRGNQPPRGKGACMEEEVSRISRRRLLKRLGLGTAVATLTPIVTSLGTEALAGSCPPCEAPCDWTCGGILTQCGS